MPERIIEALTDYSKESIGAIAALEQICKEYEQINLRIGLANLVPEYGDYGVLCKEGGQLLGLLAWYTSDGITANVNAMVHPDHRLEGVFHGLLARASEEMNRQGIRELSFRVVSGSRSGLGVLGHLGAQFNRAEYSMTLGEPAKGNPLHPDLHLRQETSDDLEFMVQCSSQAFGDSESWTREYFSRMKEPGRIAYVAEAGGQPVGVIRVNHVDSSQSVIHDFCVLPSMQGKGYGEQILTQMVKLLIEDKRTEIRLSVVTDNRNALNLYRKAGFEISAENHFYTRAFPIIAQSV